MFGTSPITKHDGPRPVWPYFFFSVLSLIVLGLSFGLLQPWALPPEERLVRTGGNIATVTIRDHISDTSAGAQLPLLTSVYFTFEGLEGEFRYPWTHPMYHQVRNRLAVNADIWVDGDELGGDEPVMIWQVEEHNDFRDPDEQITISYAEIASAMNDQSQTLATIARWFGGAAVLFAAAGFAMRWWNRRRYPGPGVTG